MCGIFGIVCGNDVTSADLVISGFGLLISASASRGKDATGIAVRRGNRIDVLKAAVRGERFVRLPEYKKLLQSPSLLSSHLTLLGHTRLATDGTPEDHANNQPITGTHGLWIHNGVIVNSADIFRRFRKLPYTGVDTESIAAVFDREIARGGTSAAGLRAVYRTCAGAASIAGINLQTGELLLATNTGSLAYTITRGGSLLFASESRIVAAVLRMILPDYQPPVMPMKPGTWLIRHPRGTVRVGTLTDRDHQSGNDELTEPLVVVDVSPDRGHRVSRGGRNSQQRLRQHTPDYRAIRELRRCRRCILPVTMPLIEFDTDGICNYCRTYTVERPLGMTALREYLRPFRSTDGKPDCIVAFSGGRDSAYGLHLVKRVLKLNPVAYTYDWGMVTDIARRNQSRITATLGVEHVIVAADLRQKRANIRRNIQAWLRKPELGMVTLFMAGDKQAEYYAEQLRRSMNIPLVIYCRGNHLEDERFKFGYFGIMNGTPGGVIHALSAGGKLRMFAYAVRQYLTNRAYINRSLLDTSFAFFSTYLMRHEFMYLWKYLPWDEATVVSTLKREYGWETPTDSPATWRIDDGSPPFYNYIYYHVQGFTEHDAFRSNQIREGIISRRRALELVHEENKPRYAALQWYFDTLELDGDEVLKRVDAIPPLYS